MNSHWIIPAVKDLSQQITDRFFATRMIRLSLTKCLPFEAAFSTPITAQNDGLKKSRHPPHYPIIPSSLHPYTPPPFIIRKISLLPKTIEHYWIVTMYFLRYKKTKKAQLDRLCAETEKITSFSDLLPPIETSRLTKGSEFLIISLKMPHPGTKYPFEHRIWFNLKRLF